MWFCGRETGPGLPVFQVLSTMQYVWGRGRLDLIKLYDATI